MEAIGGLPQRFFGLISMKINEATALFCKTPTEKSTHHFIYVWKDIMIFWLVEPVSDQIKEAYEYFPILHTVVDLPQTDQSKLTDLKQANTSKTNLGLSWTTTSPNLTWWLLQLKAGKSGAQVENVNAMMNIVNDFKASADEIKRLTGNAKIKRSRIQFHTMRS